MTKDLEKQLNKALNNLADVLLPMSAEERIIYLKGLGFDVSAKNADTTSLQEKYRKAEIDYIEAQAKYLAAEKEYHAAKETFLELENELCENQTEDSFSK